MHNKEKCGYGAEVYVRNQGPRVLGTAWDTKVIVLTWDLRKPTAVKTEAVKRSVVCNGLCSVSKQCECCKSYRD